MRLTTSIFFLLAVSASRAAPPAAWKTHTDPRGFSVSLPPGWQATGDNEVVVLQSGDRASFAIVQPFFLKQKTAAAQWIARVPQVYVNMFPGARIVRTAQQRRAPDEAVASITFDHGGQPARAALLCSMDGPSGMFYAIAAPAALWNQSRAALVRMVGSFKFGAPAAPPSTASGAPSMRYVRFVEPRENAWSVEVPQGWNTQGAVVRKGPADTRHILITGPPDGSVQFFNDDVEIKMNYMVPNQVTQMSGFYEGRMYDQGTMILRFHTGAQYLQMYVPRKFGGGCRIVDLRERQDMSQRMNALHSGALGRIVQYYYGEASFECAGGKRGYYLAATLRSDPGTGLVIWNVPVLGGFVANADKFSTGMEAMRHMQQTWQTNPAWLGRESATNMRIAQISRQAGQEMSDMISQSYWNRQRTLDDVSRKRSNATLNYADVVDPATGETWKVEGGHNYYWRRNATNEIVGSQTYNRPDIDFSPLAEW